MSDSHGDLPHRHDNIGRIQCLFCIAKFFTSEDYANHYETHDPRILGAVDVLLEYGMPWAAEELAGRIRGPDGVMTA